MSKTLSKIAEAFAETAIDGEVVVMDLASGDFFSLVDSARDTWLLIDGRRSRAEVIAALAQDYGQPEAAIAADVGAFVDHLVAAGLVDER